MTRYRHPLDDEFDMVSEGEVLPEELEVEIPEDPNLQSIIDLSLQAYKQQMDNMTLVEPKNRIRFLEVAEKFLNQAKDAMYKKEQLRMKQEAADKLKNKSKMITEDGDGEVKGAMSRDDLLKMAKEERLKEVKKA